MSTSSSLLNSWFCGWRKSIDFSYQTFFFWGGGWWLDEKSSGSNYLFNAVSLAWCVQLGNYLKWSSFFPLLFLYAPLLSKRFVINRMDKAHNFSVRGCYMICIVLLPNWSRRLTNFHSLQFASPRSSGNRRFQFLRFVCFPWSLRASHMQWYSHVVTVSLFEPLVLEQETIYLHGAKPPLPMHPLGSVC